MEHINKKHINKVYGVDINKNYLDTCADRYLKLQDIFVAVHADLTQEQQELPYAEYIVANLLIEYIGYECFQKVVNQVSPKYVSAVIQINEGSEFVSDSPYIHVFDHLDKVHRQIKENTLINAMERIGYRKTMRIGEALPNGKKLVRIDFTIQLT